MTYGILPEGFSRKPLAVILAEVEAQLITEFGPNVVQTPQTPLGQINGLFADMTTELWELAEDVYQAVDPNQAEGTRLNILGNIRLLNRTAGETDASYRQAITNDGITRLSSADFVRSLRNIPAVTFARVYANESYEVDKNNMPPNSIAVAIIGGDDLEVAIVVNKYATPGISLHGEYLVDTNIDGYCRTLKLVRLQEINTELTIRVKSNDAMLGCPTPAPSVIAASVLAALTANDTRPLNGQTINGYVVRKIIETQFENVEYLSLLGHRADQPDLVQAQLPFKFNEIANVTSVLVEVV